MVASDLARRKQQQQQQHPHPHPDLNPTKRFRVGSRSASGSAARAVDRHSAVDRRPAVDRHSAVDRVPAVDRHPAVDRVPAVDHRSAGPNPATNTDIIVNPLLLSLPLPPPLKPSSLPPLSSSSPPTSSPSLPLNPCLLDPALAASPNLAHINSLISNNLLSLPSAPHSSPQPALSTREQLANTAPTPHIAQQSLTPIKIGKNWACRICRREFTRRYNCTTHERTHLDLKERAQFQCGLCERAFTRRHDLERHIHSVHPGYILERDPTGPMSAADRSALEHARISHGLALVSDVQIRRPDDGQLLAARSSAPEPAEPLRIRTHPLLPTATSSSSHCNSPVTDALARPPRKPRESEALSTVIPASQPPAAILAAGSIRDTAQIVDRIPLHKLARENTLQEAIFRYGHKWACGTCGRLFVRRNNCKAHEATHRDIRVVSPINPLRSAHPTASALTSSHLQHQCQTCTRCFSRRHDLERHILAVHPGAGLPPRLESPEFSTRRARQRRRESNSRILIDPALVELDRAAQQDLLSSDEEDEMQYKSSKASVQAGGVFNIFEAYDVGGAEEEYEDEEEFERYAGGGVRNEWVCDGMVVDPRLMNV